MAKEEEAIKILSDSNILFNIQRDTALSIRVAIETVLNMLKEKDKEIEELKKSLARNIAKNFTSSMKESAKSKEDLEMLNAGWQIELEKKDKIIDLMAEHINYLSDELVQATGRNELEFCNGNKCCIDSDYSCEQCIKQYFKQKATNNG